MTLPAQGSGASTVCTYTRIHPYAQHCYYCRGEREGEAMVFTAFPWLPGWMDAPRRAPLL